MRAGLVAGHEGVAVRLLLQADNKVSTNEHLSRRSSVITPSSTLRI